MSRSNSTRNKSQKNIAQRKGKQAAVAVAPLVRAEYPAHAVDAIVRETVLLKPTYIQAVNPSPSRVDISQPPVCVSGAQVCVPQPPESADTSTPISATTKRCVKTVAYNKWSNYSHVGRYLEEALRFEANVKQVAFRKKKRSPDENVLLSINACKNDNPKPQELNQDTVNTTLISNGSAECGKAEVAKIVRHADENHPHEELLPNTVAPPPDLAQQDNVRNQRCIKKIMLHQQKKVDETCATLTASLEANNINIMTTVNCLVPLELPKSVASLQGRTKQDNVKPKHVKIITLAKSHTAAELPNRPATQNRLKKENTASATSMVVILNIHALFSHPALVSNQA
ncbi:hypothetical protein BJ741DRAFT_582831 [Chytriomyces cf. hyalinus JEL632]|nr:hypothetical protein BJ741DRAFT_582831 [Chytriomyces cf. hyalinus JEL632]